MNKLVLITGATGGVGASVCRHLAGNYKVLALGRKARLLDKLSDGNTEIVPWVADLADLEDVEHALDGVLTKYDWIPFVINNAGINVAAEVTAMEPVVFHKSLQVNALAPFRIMQRLLPLMVENRFGRIINITSGAPLNCLPGYAAYSASKAALNALTVTAAREHAEQNIKINLMSPGPVRSGMAPSAPMDPSVCHPTLDYLLNLGSDGPTGRFFWLGRELPLFPDLEGVAWLQGTATGRFPKILP